MRPLLFTAFLALACVAAPAQAKQSTLMVFGDSLSAAYGIETDDGWVNLLAQRLAQRDIQVVNASISGDTTQGGRARLDDALERHQPDYVVLELGANDGLRGIPPRVMEENLAAMVARIRESGAKVMMIKVPLPPNYGAVFHQRFDAAYDTVSDQMGIPSIRFPMQPFLDQGLMQSDGLHPTAKAQPMILEAVWPTLERLLDSAYSGAANAPSS